MQYFWTLRTRKMLDFDHLTEIQERKHFISIKIKYWTEKIVWAEMYINWYLEKQKGNSPQNTSNNLLSINSDFYQWQEEVEHVCPCAWLHTCSHKHIHNTSLFLGRKHEKYSVPNNRGKKWSYFLLCDLKLTVWLISQNNFQMVIFVCNYSTIYFWITFALQSLWYYF